jgi:anti-sigma B factor antagonist
MAAPEHDRRGPIDIRTDTEGGVTVVHPVGEIDAFNASQFRSAVEPVTSSSRLVIDLSGVSFVDSAGLGALIGAVRRVHELGGKVAVAGPRPPLARLLRHTGFSRIVPVAATVHDAIEVLA